RLSTRGALGTPSALGIPSSSDRVPDCDSGTGFHIMTVIRIANGQGFWGDSLQAPIDLIRRGPIDYLTLDYLAEITMSIMQKARSRDPKAGYARDFVAMVEEVLPDLAAKGVKVVANAGGVNPEACRDAVAEAVARKGLAGKISLGIVAGDDIMGRLDQYLERGIELRNLDTGAPLAAVRSLVRSANVYFGGRSIAQALDRGARIVVTGRCTDTGL